MSDGGPTNDPAIANDELLYRRLHWKHVSWNPDGSIKKINSNAFQDSGDETPCSIAIGALLAANGLRPEELLRDYEGFGLAVFRARDARDCGFGVVPTPREGEPAHADLTGDKNPNGPRRKLARRAEILTPPTRPQDS